MRTIILTITSFIIAITACAQGTVRGDDFTTYDLAAMEVKGPVKTIVWKENGCVATFDTKGRLTSYKNDSGRYDIGHNPDGCLTLTLKGQEKIVCSINPENDLMVCRSGERDDVTWMSTYTHDKRGYITKIETTADYTLSERVTSTLYVKTTKWDSHNNWTSRMVDDGIESRTITYYTAGDKSQTVNRQQNNAQAKPQACNQTQRQPQTRPQNQPRKATAFRPFTDTITFRGMIGGDNNATMNISKGEGTCHLSTGQRKVVVNMYDEETGKMIMKSYYKNGKFIGNFVGTVKNGRYSGTFTNNQGGIVDFRLRIE